MKLFKEHNMIGSKSKGNPAAKMNIQYKNETSETAKLQEFIKSIWTQEDWRSVGCIKMPPEISKVITVVDLKLFNP